MLSVHYDRNRRNEAFDKKHQIEVSAFQKDHRHPVGSTPEESGRSLIFWTRFEIYYKWINFDTLSGLRFTKEKDQRLSKIRLLDMTVTGIFFSLHSIQPHQLRFVRVASWTQIPLIVEKCSPSVRSVDLWFRIRHFHECTSHYIDYEPGLKHQSKKVLDYAQERSRVLSRFEFCAKCITMCGESREQIWSLRVNSLVVKIVHCSAQWCIVMVDDTILVQRHYPLN
jgi:hypothetical protein